MSDDYTIQVSTKLTDGTMLNVRGQSVDDVLSDVRQLAEASGDLADALSVMHAAGRAVVASNPQATQAAPAAHAQPGGAPSCDHGVRFYKETKAGSGKFVYECAAVADGRLKWNDTGACKGVWVNNRR